MTSPLRPAFAVEHKPTGETFYVIAEEAFQAKAAVFKAKGFSSAYAGGTLTTEPVPEHLLSMVHELHTLKV